MRYDGRMKSIPDPETTSAEKMQNFETGLRRVLNCSKTQLKNALEYKHSMDEGKPKRGPKPNTSASGHVSCDTD
jgi:hypothetical protein